MKKQYLTVLFALICVLELGLGARAQEEDTVVAKVPYDFVVGGKVLPAGAYRVSRVEPTTGSRQLEISELRNACKRVCDRDCFRRRSNWARTVQLRARRGYVFSQRG